MHTDCSALLGLRIVRMAQHFQLHKWRTDAAGLGLARFSGQMPPGNEQNVECQRAAKSAKNWEKIL